MPTIQTRKLIQGGTNGTSLMVTLPTAWLRYYGLAPGDEVELVTNGVVTIRPADHEKAAKVQEARESYSA
jgi:antitoxin component of MazEF toxin-antitoxin module